MKGELVNKPEMKLVGLSARTNNRIESDPLTAKVPALIERYQAGNLSSKISNQTNPDIAYSLYTEFESDEFGNYTYFIGQEVSSFNGVLPEFQALTLPANKYLKFTSSAGKLPNVAIELWQKIIQITPEELGGTRAYVADYELYDSKKTADREKATVDIYISVK